MQVSVSKIIKIRKDVLLSIVREKGVLARGQNCEKEESGNYQNNRFVTIATDAQL